MIKTITRTKTNFRKTAHERPHEIIEFSYYSDIGPNLREANVAARFLIEELAQFEPPIVIDEGDINFISSEHAGNQIVRYIRTDVTTVNSPGYMQQGYVLSADEAKRFNQIDIHMTS